MNLYIAAEWIADADKHSIGDPDSVPPVSWEQRDRRRTIPPNTGRTEDGYVRGETTIMIEIEPITLTPNNSHF